MARSMLSFGMLFAFASAMAARSRGLPSGSPPPSRAAMVISLRMRVKTLPRLASAAPFLCLMVLHLLWPDIGGCSFDCLAGASATALAGTGIILVRDEKRQTRGAGIPRRTLRVHRRGERA